MPERTYEWECIIYIPDGMSHVAWGKTLKEVKIDAVERLLEEILSRGRDEIEELIESGTIRVRCRRVGSVRK